MTSGEALPLVAAAGGAFLTPLIAGYMRIPAPVVEIIYGVFLGHFLWFKEGELLNLLAELGFLILLFLAGAETELRGQKVKISAVLTGSTVAVAIPFLFTVWNILNPFFALACGAISVGMIHVFMRYRKETRGHFFHQLLLWSSVGEILTLLILSTMPYLLEGKSVKYAAVKIGQTVLIFLGAYLFFLLIRTYTWWFPTSVSKVLQGDPSELGVRVAFAATFVMVGLAILLDIDPVLGAFLTGLIFSLVFRKREVLLSKINATAQGFLIPIFFIHVGATFNIGEIFRAESGLAFILLLGAVSFTAKFIGLLPFKSAGVSWRGILSGALVASAPLSLIVITADVGVKKGLISPVEASVLIGYALVSSIIFPALGRFVEREAQQ